jgi:energy-coupling factor transport system ATP-binding protein
VTGVTGTGVTGVIELVGVRYGYAGTRRWAIDGIDLAVSPGRVLGVVGPNEAGKSTLCLVAAGLAPAVIGGRLQGIVRLGGTDVRGLRPHEAAQRAGILFGDSRTQLSGTAGTVWEEVAFGPRNLGLGLVDIVQRVEEALTTLRIEALGPRDPMRLSGGEAQLVALASVVALRPAVLVLDEPTSELDPAGTRLVGEAIGRLARATSVAVLIVEHKTGLLADLADDVAVMSEGRIVRIGPAAEVLGDPFLAELGVDPPPRVRLARAAEARGLRVDPAILGMMA